MQRITNEIIQTLTEANKKVILLSKMNEVPWESLKIDTLLKVTKDIRDWDRNFDKVYFAKFEVDTIYAYTSGRTSATNGSYELVAWPYALPL